MYGLPELWGVDTVAEWLEACLFMVAVIATAVFALMYAILMLLWYLGLFLVTWNRGYLVD